MEKHIFVCNDENENILTAIYDAFSHRNVTGNDDIDIVITKNGVYEDELFASYEIVETDISKAVKTMNSIQKKLGEEIYTNVLRTLCHFDERRGYWLFRFLEVCFRYGKGIAGKLSDEAVLKIMEFSRKTWNEAHLFMGFIRFTETYGVLYATIEPKCNVIPLIMEHFADRYPGENWIIHDKCREVAAVHKAFSEMYLMSVKDRDIFKIPDLQNNFENPVLQDKYEELWKVFFKNIAIEERHNERCQRNLMPVWMRKHMKEVMT